MKKSKTNLVPTRLKIVAIISFIMAAELSKADLETPYASDVIDVKEEMLYAKYWSKRAPNAGAELLSAEQISSDNKRLYKTNDLMNDLASYPKTLSAKSIAAKILKISSIPPSSRFYSNGMEVTERNYHQYQQALDLKKIEAQQTVRFGMVVRRTNMRTFPTDDRVFKTTTSTNLDRFQETALFPTEVVAILHQSQDKKWFFAVSYNYSAWVRREDIAVGTRNQIFKFKAAENFLVVTGDKIHTSYNPDNEDISELQLEMGTVLPLVDTADIPRTIGGQNTYASYVILLPAKNDRGALIFQPALLSRNADVNRGFLPYTREQIINQSFKFLGERYGWGHSFNARDCTGFVGEIFKSFGILMPRNSGDQGKSDQGENARFLKSASAVEKMDFIQTLTPGDLIYIPGHVMMVLGFHEEKPFIIHDVSGLSYFKENGEYYQSQLNGVSMTPLLPLQLTPEKSYVDKIYNIKKIK